MLPHMPIIMLQFEDVHWLCWVQYDPSSHVEPQVLRLGLQHRLLVHSPLVVQLSPLAFEPPPL